MEFLFFCFLKKILGSRQLASEEPWVPETRSFRRNCEDEETIQCEVHLHDYKRGIRQITKCHIRRKERSTCDIFPSSANQPRIQRSKNRRRDKLRLFDCFYLVELRSNHKYSCE